MIDIESHTWPPEIDISDVAAITRVAAEIDRRVSSLIRPAGASSTAERKECFVTYATPEYSLGLAVLVRTLKRHSSRPIVVLTDRPWTLPTAPEDVFYVTVPRVVNLKYSPERAEIRVTLTKLWIFALLSLNRVVYVDADCLVVRSVDDLFDLQGMWCPPDYVEGPSSSRFNSGLIAFDPSVELRDTIFKRAPSTESYDHGDQGLLNAIVASEVNFLPPEYSVTRHFHFFHGAEMRSEDTRIIHYIVKKPWNLAFSETPDIALTDLDDRWTAELEHSELLALVGQWRRRQFISERRRLESLHAHPLLPLLTRRRRTYLVAAAAVIMVLLLLCSLALFLGAMAALLR